eukprot:gene13601-18255_t
MKAISKIFIKSQTARNNQLSTNSTKSTTGSNNYESLLVGLKRCLLYIEQSVNNVEGLYCHADVPSNSESTFAIQNLIRNGTITYEFLKTVNSIHIVTTAIKNILNQGIIIEGEPLFPVSLYDHFLAPNVNLKSLISSLPKPNQEISDLLLQHFAQFLDNKESKTNINSIIDNFHMLLLRPNSLDQTDRTIYDDQDLLLRKQVLLRMVKLYSLNDKSIKQDNISPITPITYSIQDRSVKISFIGQKPEENDLKNKANVFGEVINIGFKEKFAVVLFSNPMEAIDCSSDDGKVMGPDLKIKYLGNMTKEKLLENIPPQQTLSPIPSIHENQSSSNSLQANNQPTLTTAHVRTLPTDSPSKLVPPPLIHQHSESQHSADGSILTSSTMSYDVIIGSTNNQTTPAKKSAFRTPDTNNASPNKYNTNNLKQSPSKLKNHDVQLNVKKESKNMTDDHDYDNDNRSSSSDSLEIISASIDHKSSYHELTPEILKQQKNKKFNNVDSSTSLLDYERNAVRSQAVSVGRSPKNISPKEVENDNQSNKSNSWKSAQPSRNNDFAVSPFVKSQNSRENIRLEIKTIDSDSDDNNNDHSDNNNNNNNNFSSNDDIRINETRMQSLIPLTSPNLSKNNNNKSPSSLTSPLTSPSLSKMRTVRQIHVNSPHTTTEGQYFYFSDDSQHAMPMPSKNNAYEVFENDSRPSSPNVIDSYHHSDKNNIKNNHDSTYSSQSKELNINNYEQINNNNNDNNSDNSSKSKVSKNDNSVFEHSIGHSPIRDNPNNNINNNINTNNDNNNNLLRLSELDYNLNNQNKSNYYNNYNSKDVSIVASLQNTIRELREKLQFVEALNRKLSEDAMVSEEEKSKEEEYWSAEIMVIKMKNVELMNENRVLKEMKMKMKSELIDCKAKLTAMTASEQTIQMISAGAKDKADREALST